MLEDNWLTSDDALKAIATLSAETEGSHIPAKRLLRLRKQFSAEQTQFIASQIKLRTQAATRFPLAAEMLFTNRSLQQTTEAAIADFKAELIKEFIPEIKHVTDLCCGMGGDLQALATRFNVTGVDLDAKICHIAKHNATLKNQNAVDVITADASAVQLNTDWVHIDPDRRHDGLRHTDVNSLQPGIHTLDRLIDRVGDSIQGVSIKLAPASVIPEHWQDQCQLFWIQTRNECRQQLAIFTSTKEQQDSRTALAIDKTGAAQWKFSSPNEDLLDSRDVPLKGSVDKFLYEPKPAILAGRMAPSWAVSHQLEYIHSGVAYFTSASSHNISGGTCYEVLEELPFDLKRIRQHIKQHNIGRLEIKKRGVDITPEQLRKKLKPQGKNEATLVIAGNPRSQKPARAYITKCVQPE